MLDVKMTDQRTVHENAGHEIAELQNIKEQHMKLTQKLRTFEAEYIE